jgi:hypothetical protein
MSQDKRKYDATVARIAGNIAPAFIASAEGRERAEDSDDVRP